MGPTSNKSEYPGPPRPIESVNTRGASVPGPNCTGRPPENIFSDDEEERKFITDVSWISEQSWIHSQMPWNTIHGCPWKRRGKLGEGAYGAVHLGVRDDKKIFAVKSISVVYPLPDPKARRNITCQMAEIKMMRLLNCKYIVRCLGCGRSNGQNGIGGLETLDVFLEYAVRGSLRHVATTRRVLFEENPYIRQYTHDILKALQYMHTQRVVHGDLKMANLLLSDDCVKLADWGGAKQLNKMNLREILIGTLGFKSPEVTKMKEQSHPADIFSLGCTVIEMLTMHTPQEIVTWVSTSAPLQPGRVEGSRVLIPAKASPDCKDFLEHCVCRVIADRWTAAELLHHPFITNRDKTSKLPYFMPLPPTVRSSLLRHPRPNGPALPDGPPTKRVVEYLTRRSQAVPQVWGVANLMGCGPDVTASPGANETYLLTLALGPSSPRVAPLAPFQPEIKLDNNTRDLVPDALVPGNLSPNNIVELISSPTRYATALQFPEVDSPNLFEIFPGVCDEEASNSARDMGLQTIPGGPLNVVVPAVDGAQPPFEESWSPREYLEGLNETAGLMQQVNEHIFIEANLLAKEPLPDGDENDDGGRGLFPRGAKRPRWETRPTRGWLGVPKISMPSVSCSGDKAAMVAAGEPTPGNKRKP